MISTRGRYALRILLDLAEHRGGLTPIKEVSERQEISLKYAEKIMSILKGAKLVRGHNGKGGGYALTKEPEEYSVGKILRLTEGDLAPVSCLCSDADPCPRAAQCKTVGMWKKFHEMTNAYFDNISIADLMATEVAPNWVI